MALLAKYKNSQMTKIADTVITEAQCQIIQKGFKH